MWSCPICRLALAQESKHWQCSNLHSFDVAKEGYVNLLLANQKSSQDPGDNKLMVNARREFLQQGYYLPLAQRIAQLIVANTQSLALSLHDAGCGEGYYTHQVVSALADSKFSVEASGSDISKWAIAKAAKKYAQIQFAVASSFDFPKSSGNADLVLQIFAPAKTEEVSRILKPKGLWLQVTPGPTHLLELKQGVYDKAQLHEVNNQLPDGFDRLVQDSLSFKFSLNDVKSRESLLMMTPFYWSARAAEREKAISSLSDVSADFILTVFQKTDKAAD